MKKRLLFPFLATAAGFVLSYRGVAERQASGARDLGPGGSAGKPVSRKTVARRTDRAFGGKPGDRGQHADAPTEIPPRGWFDIAKRTAQKFGENELMAEAASVTFFALLSIFPALTAIVSIYGMFADPAALRGKLDSAKGLVPGGGLDIIRDQVQHLTQSSAGGLSLGAGVGILAALWSANQGSKAMLSALNRVHEQRETRGFIKLTAVSLAFTIGGIIAMFVAVGVGFILPLLFNAFGLASVADVVIRYARWPVLLLGLMAALATLYRFGPSDHRTRWQWVTTGGIFGTVVWIALSYGFSWYVANFGSYNKTYGSLGAVIGFMTWIWLSSTVLLVGAQINAEMEGQTERDTTAA